MDLWFLFERFSDGLSNKFRRYLFLRDKNGQIKQLKLRPTQIDVKENFVFINKRYNLDVKYQLTGISMLNI